jgi:hypothetical protein
MQRRQLKLLLVVDTGVTFIELPQAEKLADIVVFERPEETRQRGQRVATYCFTPIEASRECRPK